MQVVDPSNYRLIEKICGLAKRYPHPHNILGRPGAESYVRRLALEKNGAWYMEIDSHHVHACAHLSLYGAGDGYAHSLWKIRHPMISGNGYHGQIFKTLFTNLSLEVSRLCGGSAKIVSFLGEKEINTIEAIQSAGFQLEGKIVDYYRLGELCLVFGRTEK